MPDDELHFPPGSDARKMYDRVFGSPSVVRAAIEREQRAASRQDVWPDNADFLTDLANTFARPPDFDELFPQWSRTRPAPFPLSVQDAQRLAGITQKPAWQFARPLFPPNLPANASNHYRPALPQYADVYMPRPAPPAATHQHDDRCTSPRHHQS